MMLGILAAAAVAGLDPGAVAAQPLDTVAWEKGPIADQKVIAGDPAKPGLYVQLIHWHPHQMSRPHFHTNVRYITVLRGTWWVGTGTRFDPERTVPFRAGTVVTHFPRGVHYDGARDEEAIIEVVGEGPVTMTPAEGK